MEHFDESVVLLKRLLCWDFDDIVYFKLNERQDKDKRTISAQIAFNIRSWNQADFMLYSHFNKTLWRKIAAEGPEFHQDLLHFRKRQKEVFAMCVGSTALTKAYTGKFVKGYRLRKDLTEKEEIFCGNIIKSELTFIEENIIARKKRQQKIDDPGEFEDIFDEENDWDKAKDLVHHPVSDSLSSRVVNKCKPQPHLNIMFLKTHKTGSSTLTNVLNRFADERNLTVVLPRLNYYTFSWPNQFQLQDVGSLNGGPRILCNHARFNKLPLNILFPKESSKYVTLIREPVSHYESVFYFFKFDYYFRGLNGIDEFLNVRPSYLEWQDIQKRIGTFALSRNPLMFDLGLALKDYENRTAIKAYTRFLDQEFDLVLVLEHFDESLVLMKRMFCWEIKDILYFKQMERLTIDKNKEYLTNELKRKIRRWNEADVMLYDYFNATLWKKIEMEGPGFYEDLKLFRQELHRTKNACLLKQSKKTLAYTGRYVIGYQLKHTIPPEMKPRCTKMLLNEIHYVDYFQNKTVEVEELGWPGDDDDVDDKRYELMKTNDD
ncbi:hypothetical protein QZH41_013661 [Actinostola sp. cb2023]|nr:hypothetical protein QZH41_013661 [Actinostola sp. cb2023]